MAALTNRTAAGTRVFPSRLAPLRMSQLPALSVYVDDESVDTQASASTAPRELARSAQVAIECAVSATANVDDALDDLAYEVETAMHADPGLDGTAGDAILLSTALGLTNEGDRPLGVVRLVYQVTYYTFAPEPGTLDDLKTVDAKWTSTGGASLPAANQAEDRLTDLDER